MVPINKRNQISIDKKMKILAEIDKNTVSKSEIARMFDIKKSTLFTILKNRDKISAANVKGVPKSRIRSRDGKFPLLEKALIEWLQLMRSTNTPIDGNFLKEKATTFAEKMNVDFKVSNGWFENFKDRHGLSFKKLCGESASVDLDCVSGWRKEELKRIFENYEPKDIFNADETGLYYKLLPNKSIALKGETGHGGKLSKERLTVLIAANMTGSEKLPLLVIGKSANPRCFKTIKSFPTTYRSNKKAWMTSSLFEEWLRDLDRKMAVNNRKILLIIDNCTAHPTVTDLKAVKVKFLPPNVTAVLQPMDQGVIQNFKSNYRKMIIRRMIVALENKKSYEIDVLGAMHLAKTAWDDVTTETIANCFRHAGFTSKEELDKESEEITAQISEVRPSAEPSTASSCIQTNDDDEMEKRLQEINFPGSFAEFVTVDNELQCCEEFSNEDELIARIMENDDEISDSDDQEETVDRCFEMPTAKSAYDAAEILRKYFEREDGTEDFLQKLTEMENFIAKNSQNTLKQSTITQFFLEA